MNAGNSLKNLPRISVKSDEKAFHKLMAQQKKVAKCNPKRPNDKGQGSPGLGDLGGGWCETLYGHASFGLLLCKSASLGGGGSMQQPVFCMCKLGAL